MKKNRKLLFVLSIITQLASFGGAVYMFFRKNKTAAGALAVLGGAATVFGIALLGTDEKKTAAKKQSKSKTKKLKEKTDSEIQLSAEQDIACCEIELDTDTDTNGIDIAIDILKKASEPADDADSELESTLNDSI